MSPEQVLRLIEELRQALKEFEKASPQLRAGLNKAEFLAKRLRALEQATPGHFQIGKMRAELEATLRKVVEPVPPDMITELTAAHDAETRLSAALREARIPTAEPLVTSSGVGFVARTPGIPGQSFGPTAELAAAAERARIAGRPLSMAELVGAPARKVEAWEAETAERFGMSVEEMRKLSPEEFRALERNPHGYFLPVGPFTKRVTSKTIVKLGDGRRLVDGGERGEEFLELYLREDGIYEWVDSTYYETRAEGRTAAEATENLKGWGDVDVLNFREFSAPAVVAPRAGEHVNIIGRGRAYVERVNPTSGTVDVRFDPGEGVRGPVQTFPLSEVAPAVVAAPPSPKLTNVPGARIASVQTWELEEELAVLQRRAQTTQVQERIKVIQGELAIREGGASLELEWGVPRTGTGAKARTGTTDLDVFQDRAGRWQYEIGKPVTMRTAEGLETEVLPVASSPKTGYPTMGEAQKAAQDHAEHLGLK